jgi:hypothetical protein
MTRSHARVAAEAAARQRPVRSSIYLKTRDLSGG